MKKTQIKTLFGLLFALILVVSCSSNALGKVDKGRELAQVIIQAGKT
ncbi:hypothetical protein [Weeksella virosa]|mgnify:CR=1 FL=1|uniref:Uncharacterized protein n=1 Tax=Weeksella virosa (strain ATCC 43766 / DSM 16922 / JCM 21250 / CCUG 30538 / CDC 9751 / IAM 14551 / NBRC 16016 / NCTC 11634 / CL345/78) TaxID=865938 RepID=F0NZU1_WEEVC|nr:hypothetical protein [Weeksella virosa]ADX68365.1 hypothetical protein Weevi_1669 [Weeksella virosa DSM 16922]MDK7674676.1 hypothetical protein [Weeksella virosa]VEH63991.1 Uncharacterised protein [Weeksella virosa]